MFAFLTLLCGVLVIANPFSRNPVTSAMFLVLTIISMAGLFVLLHAFFLAAVQILVYAGAVMVLFLFVIMLLDLKEEERRKIKKFGLIAGLVSVGAIVTIFVKCILAAQPGANLSAPTLEGETAALGKLLFTQYLLPFEVVSVLLLVAMMGVILLSKKDLEMRKYARRKDADKCEIEQFCEPCAAGSHLTYFHSRLSCLKNMNVGLEHYLVVSALLFAWGCSASSRGATCW